MANTYLNTNIIAQEALMILENNCVFGNLVFRGYENEYTDGANAVNGYTPGQTISVRRPTDFTVRDGRTTSIQDVVEGSFPIVVNKQKGVDFNFSSIDLTLNIKELSERVIRPAMVQLANQIDTDLASLYNLVYNWVGTPLSTGMTSFSQFIKATERLDLLGVPTDQRVAVLGPRDKWGLVGSQASYYMQGVATDAFRRGTIGEMADVAVYASQNIQTHTPATRQASPTLQASQSTTYAATLNSNTMTLLIGGVAVTGGFNAGDVFSIDGVFAVNPVTKATQAYLQQFVVVSTVTGSAITGTTTLTITPPIITTGAFKTVSAAPAQSALLTLQMGANSVSYAQNLVFHRNAMALVMVPMVMPPGAVDVSRRSYKGYSVRVIPFYDGTSDLANYRLDVLYGVKMLDPRLITRLNG